MNDTNTGEDIFARIATERLAQRAHRLAEQQPPAIPDKVLPLDERPGSSAFRPRRRLDTAEKLARELDRERRRMEKYLRNRAPKLEVPRHAMPVNELDWRVETDEDRRDFASHTLSGGGEWERVRIPHYGPPLGPAVTYYRTTLRVTRSMAKRGSLWICFDGVDYRAHVFFNGAYAGSHEGFFAPFECHVTGHARVGENVLLVKVENDTPTLRDGEKIYAATGPGYDDPEEGWHHCPPGMGIYQPVRLEARARQFVRDLAVVPLDLDGNAEIRVDVVNTESEPAPVAFEISVFGRNFTATPIRDLRHEPATTQIRGHGDLDQFTDASVPQPAGRGVNSYRIPIRIPRPRPWDLETPWLYQLQLRLLEGETVVDAAECQFGIRTFEQDESSTPKGRFYLNGREIRLRGANTMGHLQQCVIRGDDAQLTDDILLAKIANMNFLRLTQRPVQRAIYERCDQLGLMTQTDLPLFGKLRRTQAIEAVRQAGEMERLIRPHASAVLVSFINEPFPNATGQPHRHLTRGELEAVFGMAADAVRLENPQRVIKCCDGDYDPPAPFGMPDNHCYCGWYIGHGLDLGKLNRGYWLPVTPGWYYGCGEFGSEGLDFRNTMERFYPARWLPGSPDEERRWTPGVIAAAQTEKFHHLWYETPEGLDDWIAASHAFQAWITRLMTEAFRRDARMNTFAIHLFIDAWPAGWMKTIMDTQRQPKPAYFAFRDALTPLAVSLRSDRFAFRAGEPIELEAWVCNDTDAAPEGMTLRYRLEHDGRVVQSGQAPAVVARCAPRGQGRIVFEAPRVDRRGLVTARLALLDSEGHVVHDTSFDLDVFPREADETGAAAGTVRVIGARDGRAARLARELGLRPRYSGSPGSDSVILVDDMDAFAGVRENCERAVRDGATLVFLELPAGTWRPGGGEIRVVPGGMGKRHFVSRATGHRLVDGFEANDFRFWYDAEAGYVTPILETVIDPAPDGWKPVLMSGNGSWQRPWGPAPAAVSMAFGAGEIRVCQVKLPDRTAGNPVAEAFARRLLLLPADSDQAELS
ncbi:MAG: glycoside hydrolase family 2 protein [bacterium]